MATTDNTGTYGDAGRNIIRGPGSFNIDASLIKNTKIGHVATEFRIEAFNVLNHPQFAQPEHDDRQRGRRDASRRCCRARRARCAGHGAAGPARA